MQALADGRQDFDRGEEVHPRGSQFDCQRHAFDQLADRGDLLPFACIRAIGRADAPRRLQKERQRRRSFLTGSQRLFIRIETLKRVELLPRQAQRCAGSHQYPHLGGSRDDVGHKLHILEQMLGIVQHQEHMACLQEVDDLLFR